MNASDPNELIEAIRNTRNYVAHWISDYDHGIKLDRESLFHVRDGLEAILADSSIRAETAKNSGEVAGYVWSDKLEQLHSGKWGSIDLSRQSGDTPLYLATPANSRAEAIGECIAHLEKRSRDFGLGSPSSALVYAVAQELRALLTNSSREGSNDE